MEPHKITESEFLKLNENNVLAVHAWAIRDLLEAQVRLFIFGKREKPTKESLISDFKRFYSESLDKNKGYLSIGFCNALLSKEGNFVNGKPLYNVDRNINCNMPFNELIKV